MGERSGRITYLDRVKALGMVSVALIHSGAPRSVVDVVLVYVLPLFYFVSGYVYKDEDARAPGRFLLKRVKSLYLPFVAWNLAFLALHNLTFKLHFYDPRVAFFGATYHPYRWPEQLPLAGRILLGDWLEPLAAPFHFVITLFLVNVLFVAVSSVSLRLPRYGEWVRGGIVLALMGIGMTNQQVWDFPYTFNVALVGMSIFYLGFLFRRYEDRIPMHLAGAVAAGAVVYFARGRIDLVSNHYGSVWVFLVAMPAGAYLGVYLAKLVGDNAFLEYLGRNTLFVLGLHVVALKLVSVAKVLAEGQPRYLIARYPVYLDPQGWWWAAFFVGGLLLPLGLKYALDRGWAAVSPTLAPYAQRLRAQPSERSAA